MRAPFVALAATALMAGAASAKEEKASVTGDNVSPVDVAMTPVNDLNLRKDPIPPVLLQARKAPYGNEHTGSCQEILQEIGLLDAVLGEDYDTATKPRRKLTATGVAQKIVGFLIPYRSVIREVSGANGHEWEFRQAIAAGLMRRAYLKGRGEVMDCPYPASPMPEADSETVVATEGEGEELPPPPPAVALVR